MTRIELNTEIKGTLQEVFDLSRSIDFHVKSAAKSKEKAIEGVTSGLINLNETVRWRGRHFGLYLTHTSKIIEMVKNESFTDVMTQGHFTYFIHQHIFKQTAAGVNMIDKLQYKVPYGPLGWIIDRLFIKRHLHNFLLERNQQIKHQIENSNS